MRSIWSGSLSFGLINIPIKLYSATEDHEISFDLLHKKDHGRIRYARICKEEEKEVPWEDIVKGYEYQKGEYVEVTDEDFAKVNIEKSGTIDIQAFTDSSEIESLYFEKPYYLEPDKGAAKAYALLRESLYKTGKVGIAKFVLRNREHIAVIRPHEDVLVLNQLRFADEVRSYEDLKLPDADTVSKKEMDIAVKLIEQLTDEFDINQYKDTYVEDLRKVIDEKLQGIERKAVKPSSKITPMKDIMSLLKQSLEQEKKRKEPKRTAVKPKKQRAHAAAPRKRMHE